MSLSLIIVCLAPQMDQWSTNGHKTNGQLTFQMRGRWRQSVATWPWNVHSLVGKKNELVARPHFGKMRPLSAKPTPSWDESRVKKDIFPGGGWGAVLLSHAQRMGGTGGAAEPRLCPSSVIWHVCSGATPWKMDTRKLQWTQRFNWTVKSNCTKGYMTRRRTAVY